MSASSPPPADDQAAPPVVTCFTCLTPIEPEESGPTRYGWRHVSGRAADWNHDPEPRAAPAVAVPAETRDAPHDPAHLMYDADTGVCLDCDRIVDPIAAPVAAAFPAAMRAYQDVAEFTEAEDAERVVTAILRAAFRTALKGTS